MVSGRRRNNSISKRLHALSPARFGILILVGIFILALVLTLLQHLWSVADDLSTGHYAPKFSRDEAGIAEVAQNSVSSRGSGASGVSAPMPPIDPRPGDMQTTGSDAEEFETTDYDARIETLELEKVCGEIEALKQKTYVVFENAARHDHSCTYSFKVENDHADEVLGVLERNNPEYLTERTYTIKPTLDLYLDEVEIAERRLVAVEEALTEAEAAYQELSTVATESGDAETLAKAIAERVRIIDQLTQARLHAKREFDRVSRQMALMNDRLEFSYFNVDVRERVVVSWEDIKDSWMIAARELGEQVNHFLQGLTVSFLTFLLELLLVAFYVGVVALLLLYAIKYGMRIGKDLWKK